ncbi:MAG: AcrR family transcriptional regulator [Sulfitobacter sp.]|jgi:AcrR family transcriptional regulator
MHRVKTKDKILEIAGALLITEGLSAVSFDAIARQLGRTKQAVLYWYPTKQDLLAAMFLPALEAEAEAAEKALCEMPSRNRAIAAFVTAIAEFHFSDLERFRLMYLLPQTIRPMDRASHNTALLGKVHPVTDRLYGALAQRLGRGQASARQEALAVHSATLGLVLMFGLSDSVMDPLKHSKSDMMAALIAVLTSSGQPC